MSWFGEDDYHKAWKAGMDGVLSGHEESFAIARAWAALADVLRTDDKHRIFGPYSRRTLEDAEKGLRPLVFKAKQELDT